MWGRSRGCGREVCGATLVDVGGRADVSLNQARGQCVSRYASRCRPSECLGLGWFASIYLKLEVEIEIHPIPPLTHTCLCFIPPLSGCHPPLQSAAAPTWPASGLRARRRRRPPASR
eukprot:358237-Chlamydomonas_euryale.AAC.2